MAGLSRGFGILNLGFSRFWIWDFKKGRMSYFKALSFDTNALGSKS
jgi:hypothetical protein